jgi:hypothetical protein
MFILVLATFSGEMERMAEFPHPTTLQFWPLATLPIEIVTS